MRIHDVAKALKVSVATVSRALSPSTSHLVAEKTRQRIEAYVEKSGYVPNRTARELSTGKTRTIGLLLPNILESIFFNDYLIKVLGGVYKVLEQQNQYNCKIIIQPHGKVLTDLDHQVVSSGIDGLLLSPYCDPLLYGLKFPKSLLAKWSQPVVLVNLNVSQMKRFNCVYTDHFEAAKRAVAFLIQKGHHDIAVICGNDAFPESTARYEGYVSALADHGLALRKSHVGNGNFTVEGGYNATLPFFRGGGTKPTAIFCANDEMAIGALRALKSLKIRCPQDVAVMGFDGIDLGGFVEPRLTSMAQPIHEIAEASTRLLIDLIEKRLTGPVIRSILSQILVRDSV